MGEIFLNYIQSPLNYTGGKYKLLPQIIPLFYNTDNFIDLFCGGGNVGANVNYKNILMNDINSYVIQLLQYLKNNDDKTIKQNIDRIIKKYNLTQSHIYGTKFYTNERIYFINYD